MYGVRKNLLELIACDMIFSLNIATLLPKPFIQLELILEFRNKEIVLSDWKGVVNKFS